MTKPMIRIHDSITNEIVDREMTAAEFKAYESQQAIDAAQVAELEKAETAKAAAQAKLAALGLTVDDLEALGL
jgi:hypothetical protein